MKTLALFDAKNYDIDSFEKQNNGRYKITYYDTKLTMDSVSLAKDKDAVCCFVNDNINKEVIDKLVEYGIGVLLLRCAGYNNVDIEYAKDKLKILRVPAYSPFAVAEHAFALLLTLERKIHKAYLRTREFNFELSGLTGHCLHNQTVGIIGTGKIGQCFAEICKGFGMKILAYDPFPNFDLGYEYVSLDRLISESKIISLHCPLTEGTYHIINKENIEKMQDRVVIINTSRGGLIDSKALLEGLENGKIRGAGLDVYEEESDLFFEDNSHRVDIDDNIRLLISLPNVVLTAHQGYLTYEALYNIAETTLGNLDAYLKGEELVNEVKA